MAGEEHSAEDRTEGPTQRRLEQAREAGQLPVSRDLTMLASLGGAVLGGIALAPMAGARMAHDCAGLLGMFDQIRLDGGAAIGGPLGGAIAGMLLSAVMLVGAVALPSAACSIASVLLQTQFYVGGAPVRFQMSRISPMAGLGRIFSSRQGLDFLKSCFRLSVLLLLIWSVLRRTMAENSPILDVDATWLLPVARGQVEALGRPLLVALAVFAGIDIFLVRFQHARSMRMTREQVRLDARDADGDPYIKARLRRIRAQRAKRRMMAKVKTADVVVTNPTHYAVALCYERGGSGRKGPGAAPRVVAKEADLVAARIREEAAAHGVPVVPNPPLARALYQVELDREIPAEHYRAVAEVIAFVWKLKTRAGMAQPGMTRPGMPGARP